MVKTKEKKKKSKVLDVTKKQECGYCIPTWLRDEQIKINIQKCKARIEPHYEIRDDPIALVCYGPSLNDTWEEIKKFKYIMTCSGAHKFLIDRGIIPTYHLDVDPRPHKVKLIGTPHKDVEYLIASTCHPTMFDYLKDYNLKLWHIFDNAEEGLRTLPHGEWSLTGGCSAGTRLLTLARFLGFRIQHIFGMDGCEGKTGKHAAEHPNQSKEHNICHYNGVEYRTTPAMLEAARNVWHELDMMKDIEPHFYGEGLVQAMFKDYVRKASPADTFIAFNKPELISKEYKDLNKQLYETNLAYGVGGGKHAPVVLELAKKLNTNSILDYGCGKGYLAKAIPFPIWEYDPCIPGKDESPRPADLCVCTDVLEHIEPDKLNFVLDDLRRCTKKLGYFVIHTKASGKFLSDGRNTHLIQKNKKWWKKKLSEFFQILDNGIVENPPLLHVIVGPKNG